MEWLKSNLSGYYHFIFAFSIVSIAFAAFNFTNPPLFPSTDNFVLFAQEEIKLEQGVQISSGDLGSNAKIDIEKDAIVNGNLFANEINVDKNTTINGNASFNKIKLHKDAKILGTQTKPVSLPIANLPEIPDFSIGTQDFKFKGQDNSLAAGNYRNLTLEKDGKLVLSGGTYNLSKLELKENSIIIFNAPTTLNIQFKLKGQEHVVVLPGNNNIKPTDLVINYLGIKPKNEKEEKEDDDDEINAFHDNQEKKDYHERKIGRPVIFGKESFLNFKLLAPKASIKIGEFSTIRGQILARKVKVEKDSVLSKEISAIKEFDPTKVIIDSEKSVYPANEVIVNFTTDAAAADAQLVAEVVNGRIVGHIGFANAYQIQVPAATETELDVIINKIKSLNNSKVEGVFPNFIKSIEGL